LDHRDRFKRHQDVKKAEVSNWPTSMTRSFAAFGDHWNLTIMMKASMGAQRFEDFQRPTKMNRSVLTQRLEGLIALGILRKVEYQSKPPRFHYQLTEKGLATTPILFAMASWDEKFDSESSQAPQRYWHSTCGNETHAVVVCAQCGQPVSAYNMVTEFLTPYAIAFAQEHRATAVTVTNV